MADKGWVSLWREVLDKPIWLLSTSGQRSVLIAILLSVNHAEKNWEWKGKPYVAKPGQMITSMEHLAEKSGKGVTRQVVRGSLERFEKLGFLTKQSTKVNTLITIVNWGKYQGEKSNTTNQSTNAQPTSNQPTTTNNNVNNENNVNKEHTSKKSTPTYGDQSPYLVLAKELFEEIKKNNPEVKKPKLQNWANDMRLMVERDKRTVEKVSRMVKWSQNDDFWSGVVLSASSLRRNYDTMAGQANRVVKGNRGQRVIQKETLPDWAESEYQAPDTETDPELQKKMEERLKKLRGGN